MFDKTTSPSHWVTCAQLSEIQPAFTSAALRWHIFNSRQNGLDGHIRRLGRKVLIDAVGFAAWVETQSA